MPRLVNIKGFGTFLEACNAGLDRVVHIGSCPTAYPGSTAFARGSMKMEADVRRPDGSMYAVQKRLQEEMCRQVRAYVSASPFDIIASVS